MTTTSLRRPLRSVAGAAVLVAGLFSGAAALANVSFEFNYLDPAGTGFKDPNDGAARRAALEDAASRFSAMFGTHFQNSGTVSMDVTATFNPTGSTLASAGSFLSLPAGSPAGFNIGDVVRVKLQTGVDLTPGSADGTVNVNFGQSWELNHGTPVSDTRFDFYSTVYHEFTHALGFSSLIRQDGSDLFGTGQNWGKFDEFISDKNGLNVISGPGYTINQALWSTISVGGNVVGANGLYFNGANARLANGNQPVPIYSPGSWEDGSSGSHVADFPPYDEMLMRYATPPGPGPRDFSAVEIGMLQDLGYSLAAVPEPATLALWLLGLGLVGHTTGRRARCKP